MDELHGLATETARRLLASRQGHTNENSRLFGDMRQMALGALQTVRLMDLHSALLSEMKPLHGAGQEWLRQPRLRAA